MHSQDSQLDIETDCREVKQLLDSEDEFLLVDCREPDEHATAHIDKAMLLPMSQWEERAAEIETYRDMRVVVHCHLGGRSLQVAQWLREHGFSKAQSMAGGIDQWSLEIDPTVPRY